MSWHPVTTFWTRILTKRARRGRARQRSGVFILLKTTDFFLMSLQLLKISSKHTTWQFWDCGVVKLEFSMVCFRVGTVARVPWSLVPRPKTTNSKTNHWKLEFYPTTVSKLPHSVVPVTTVRRYQHHSTTLVTRVTPNLSSPIVIPLISWRFLYDYLIV